MKLFGVLTLFFISFTQARPPQEYVDVFIPYHPLGDNLIYAPGPLQAARDFCQKKTPPCKVRVWGSPSTLRALSTQGASDLIFTKPLIGNQAFENADISWAFDQAYKDPEIQNSSLMKGTLKRSEGGLFKKVFTLLEPSLVSQGFPPESAYTSALIKTLLNPQYRELRGLPPLPQNENQLLQLLKGETQENWKYLFKARSSMAGLLVPPHAADLAKTWSKGAFPQNPEKEKIFINLTTGKKLTDPLNKTLWEEMLKDIIKTHGEKYNIVLADVSSSKGEALDIKRHLNLFENFQGPDGGTYLRMKKYPQVVMLGPKDIGKGIQGALSASSQTRQVITVDTGVAHLAGALRSDRPGSVTTIFGYLAGEGHFYQSNLYAWGVPHQKNHYEEIFMAGRKNIVDDDRLKKQVLVLSDGKHVDPDSLIGSGLKGPKGSLIQRVLGMFQCK